MKQIHTFSLLLVTLLCYHTSNAQAVYTSPVSGPGACDGSAMIVSSYTTWDWEDSLANVIQHEGDSITDLCAGSYYLAYTDSSGTHNEPFTINEGSSTPDSSGCGGFSGSLSAIPSTDSLSCNGEVSVGISGGTAPYSYNWSNGGPDTTFIYNLCAGSYSVVVTDGNGCTITLSTSIQDTTNTGPCANFVSYVDVQPATDSLCNGGLQVEVSGGTAPFSYSWSNTSDSSSVLNNLCPGTYSVTVTDANGCVTNNSSTVSDTVPGNDPCNGFYASAYPIPGFDSLHCTGQIITTVYGGVAPYTYEWLNGTDSSGVLTNLCAGTYSAVITDANGCTTSVSVIVTDSTQFTGGNNPFYAYVNTTESSDDVNCTGTATVSVSGGQAPYTYHHSGGSTSAYAEHLCEGYYTVQVTDANGLIANLDYLVVDSSDYIDNNSSPDSVVAELNTHVIVNCDFDFTEVDSIYLDAYTSSSPDSVTYRWVVVTPEKKVYITATYYVGNSPDGVYGVTVYILCPERSEVQYLKVHDRIYLQRSSLSVSQQEKATAFTSYPNPFTESLTIQVSEAGTYTFTLLDLSGRTVRTETAEVSSAYQLQDLGSISKGQYLLQIVNGSQVSTRKVIH